MTDIVRVPKEPTPEMLKAGSSTLDDFWKAQERGPTHVQEAWPGIVQIYAAMLAASPQGEGSSGEAYTHRAAEGGVVGWQDISTAPKDGTKFDAWDRDGRITDVYWSDIQEAFCTDGPYGPEEPLPVAFFPALTHWRSLPNPPAEPQWIKHDGGPNPFDDDRLVECRFGDGSQDVNEASIWDWSSKRAPIIAYRVTEGVKP